MRAAGPAGAVAAWAGQPSSARPGPVGAQAVRQSSAGQGPASGVGPTCGPVVKAGSDMYRMLAQSAVALAFGRFARSGASAVGWSRRGARAAPSAGLRAGAAEPVAVRWPDGEAAARPVAPVVPAAVVLTAWALRAWLRAAVVQGAVVRGAVVRGAVVPAVVVPAAGARAVAAAVKAAPAWAAGLAYGVRLPVWAAAGAVPVLPRARLVAERAAASVAPGLPR